MEQRVWVFVSSFPESSYPRVAPIRDDGNTGCEGHVPFSGFLDFLTKKAGLVAAVRVHYGR
jgi:hypothetical protein